MRKLLFGFCIMALFVFSCTDEEKMEQLTQENANLTQQLDSLVQENTQLKDDFKKLQKNFDQLQFLTNQMKDVRARLVTNYGDIEIKFFAEKAPLHCFNFITRAECGYYNNTQFHRVIPGFMIQAGDPNSRDSDPYNDGQGGPLVNIPHEVNETDHQPGILSMARVSDPTVGAGSQFFIMHGSAAHLNGQYTAFGEVESGMDVVNEIANVRTYGAKNPRLQTHPVDPVVIERIEIYRVNQ
jgi:cyclophilin family peptidyl-prolyl cis-trans isomerase